MSARILKGKERSTELRKGLAARAAAVAERRGTPPRLAILAIGGSASAQVFLKNKLQACEKAGIETTVESLPESISEAKAQRIITDISQDPEADGIILDRPIPNRLDAQKLTDAVSPDKDVEGVTSFNLGRFYSHKSYRALLDSGHPIPCTPHAVLELILSTGVDPKGKTAVVLGRSGILGKPAAHLLTCLDATVTLCHTGTEDIAAHVREADILVAAMGQARFVKGDWIKKGAVVIDAGVNKGEGGLAGDVDFRGAETRAGFLTPVPGGVGPLTVTFLLHNTVVLAERHRIHLEGSGRS